jgi:hypothetical protein
MTHIGTVLPTDHFEVEPSPPTSGRSPGLVCLPPGHRAGKQRGSDKRAHLPVGWWLADPSSASTERRSRGSETDPQRLQPCQPPPPSSLYCLGVAG